MTLRAELVSLELQALAQLLHCWANPGVVHGRWNQWPEKLTGLRSAVPKGLRPKGERGRVSKVVSPELLVDEKAVVNECVESCLDQARTTQQDICEDWLRGVVVPVEVEVDGDEFRLERPFIGPRSELASVVQFVRRQLRLREQDKLDGQVCRLTGVRLGVGADTVRTTEREFGDEIGERTACQRQLASVFLDFVTSNKDVRLQALILDALYRSKYHVLCLYYLVQLGHKLKHPVSVGLPDRQQVQSICNAILGPQYNPATLPFSRHFADRRFHDSD